MYRVEGPIEWEEKEKKTRKQWLFFSVVTWIGFPAFYTVVAPLIQKEPLTKAYLDGLLSVTLSSLLLYAIYHCACKKLGTRLLTFFLFLDAFLLIAMLAVAFKSNDWLPLSEMCISGCLYVGWILLSLKLRKTIKKIKERRPLDENYQQVLKDLHSAATLADLETQFSSLIQKWPRFERGLTQE